MASDKMKVVILSWGYIEYCIQLANALTKKCDVTLIVPIKYKNYCNNHKEHTLRILTFTQYRLRNPMNLISSLDIAEKIKSICPDIIHVQDSDPWFSLILMKLISFPIVVTLHDPKQHLGEEKLWETFRDKRMKKYAKRYIVHGKFLKLQLRDILHTPLSIIDVVPHGNFNLLAKRISFKHHSKFKKILFFGRIWPYKGLEYLIKSEPLIRKHIKDFKIIIAGKGEPFERYKNLMIKKNSFEIHNRFIKNSEVPKFFADCDIVVLPYIEATQSGVISMAYTFKKAIVATNVGSIPEIVKNGVTGILVKPKDIQALSKAIISLLKNTHLRKKLANNGFKKSQNDLNWNQIASKTFEIYKKCMKN